MPKLIIEVDMKTQPTLFSAVELMRQVLMAFHKEVGDVRIPAEPKQHSAWLEEKGVLLVVEGGDADAQPDGPIKERKINVRVAFSGAEFDTSNWGVRHGKSELQCAEYSVGKEGARRTEE